MVARFTPGGRGGQQHPVDYQSPSGQKQGKPNMRKRIALSVAVFVALILGLGYASTATASSDTYPWDSADIKNQSLLSVDLAPNSVGSSELQAIGTEDVKYNSLNGWDIENGMLTGVDTKDGSLGIKEFSADAKAALKGDTGDQGVAGENAVTTVTTDGPYPGATNLTHGDNSTAKWTGDAGATLQSSWVTCAEGETAIGGGFSRADEGVAAFKNLQVVTSAPALIVDGNIISLTGEGLPDHIVNEDWSYVPNAWLVEGFNNGDTELIVRPHIVCATVNAG
jgi:hypothetical protein